MDNAFASSDIMFCNSCGNLLRPVDGSMICPRCDSKKFEEVERAQEKLIPSWGGTLRKRDTGADRRARRERATKELITRLQSLNLFSRKATASELREVFGLAPSANVIVLKDGRSISLRTNWVKSRENPRFPLGIKSPVKRFDFVVFALTDNDENFPTKWWIMYPKEVFSVWHMGDEETFGYVDVEDIPLYHDCWERFQ